MGRVCFNTEGLSACTYLDEHPMCNTITFRRGWGLVLMADCLATAHKALGPSCTAHEVDIKSASANPLGHSEDDGRRR